MANLTITVDEETPARLVRAIERGESVNQYLADRLREYADDDGERARRRASAQRFVALSEELSGSSHGRAWTRDELYARSPQATRMRVFRHQRPRPPIRRQRRRQAADRSRSVPLSRRRRRDQYASDDRTARGIDATARVSREAAARVLDTLALEVVPADEHLDAPGGRHGGCAPAFNL